ncbi:MAG: class I SAM-dependent methyltransferase [Acidobacteria bacterium]|nr:class I SAM-dependent methyltransferase [Acidobacteriota bacterium]
MTLSDLFGRLRKDKDGSDTEAIAADAPVCPSRVLSPFLAGLATKQRPVLLDLGPVVGSNVTFFGEEVGCKIFVEDLSADLDRHVREGKVQELPAFFERRFPQESETVDGILCWDIFDHMERSAAERLASQLTRLLRPDGLLLAFFGTADPRSLPRPTYTRHVVVDKSHLQYRPYQAARPKQKPSVNRDIQRLFEHLKITENVLLKTNLREVLFRKPALAATSSSAGTPVQP